MMYLMCALYVPSFSYNLLSLLKGTINDDHKRCVITQTRSSFEVEASVGDQVDLYILRTLGKKFSNHSLGSRPSVAATSVRWHPSEWRMEILIWWIRIAILQVGVA